MKKGNLANQVYDLVKRIPKGEVMTYGQIAQVLGKPKASRAIGNILHRNFSPQVPCHRVVNKEGRVALNFAHGGQDRQRELLLKEGVKFKDRLHVIR